MRRLLDLFCGAGGCAVGYHRAGFEIVGVDLAPQPRYPFEFHRGDALEFLAEHGREFDAIHASPPCQAYTTLRARHRGRDYPDMVPDTLDLLDRIGRPYIVENVPGAGLVTHVILCGSMFGLGAWCDGQWRQLRRHRHFACSWYFLLGLRCRHRGGVVGVYGKGGANRCNAVKAAIKGFTGNATERREAMGIDWMSRYELSQAIPPAYTEHLGWQLMRHLGEEG